MNETKTAQDVLEKFTVTIDFDKTIADTDFPTIKSLFLHAKGVINKWYEQGIYIIINSCRSGKHALEAETYLLEQGVKFHKFNNQHPIVCLLYSNDTEITHGLTTRKIYSHVNIDDTNIDWVINGHPGWGTLDSNMQYILSMQEEKWNIKPNYLQTFIEF